MNNYTSKYNNQKMKSKIKDVKCCYLKIFKILIYKLYLMLNLIINYVKFLHYCKKIKYTNTKMNNCKIFQRKKILFNVYLKCYKNKRIRFNKIYNIWIVIKIK